MTRGNAKPSEVDRQMNFVSRARAVSTCRGNHRTAKQALAPQRLQSQNRDRLEQCLLLGDDELLLICETQAKYSGRLFFLPLPPNSSSPTHALASFISRKHLTTAKALPAYNLDHRLFVDTSSLLPHHDQQARRYTQFLTLSHLAGKTYVGTSASHEKAVTNGAPAENDGPVMNIISIPTGLVMEELFWTITQKMQPLWAFRSGLRVENGIGLDLGDGSWRVRIGELKISAGQGQGRVRGTVIEVESDAVRDDDEDSTGGEDPHEDWVAQEAVLRSFWDSLVHGSDINMDSLKCVVNVPVAGTSEKHDLLLVRQYMELLRFARA